MCKMNGEVSFQRCISVKKEMLIDGSEYSDISRCSSSSDDQKLDSQLYWLRYYDNPTVVIDVLTPNGLLIQLNISRESTLYDVKEELFDTAQKQPLFGVLQDKMAYLFSCVNILTAEQEIFEDDKKICEIRPFFQLLRLIEKQDDRTEKQLNAQIGFLIGKGLHEFDGLKISEVNNFRWRAREFSTQVEHKRSRNNWLEQIYYNYPVRVEPITGIPKYLRPVLESTKNQILIELRFESSKHFRTLNGCCFDSVNLIVQNAIKLFNLEQSNECVCTTDFALKVSGQEEYLFGSYQLIQYAYIRECLSNSKTPSLVVKDMEKLKKARERCILTATGSDSDSFRSRCASSFSSPSGAGQLRIKQQPETLFDIGQDSMLTLQVRGCIRINCSDNGRVALLIGVYHGQSLLCARKVSQCALVRSGRIQLDERIEFDLSIRDLPRMARYSMLLFQVLAPSTSKSAAASSRKQSYGSTSLANVTLNACSTPPVSASALTNASPLSTCVPLTDLSGQVNPLCWVNCTLFDHKGFLRTGGSTLPMWPSVVDSSQSTLSVATLLRSIRRIRDNACAIDDIDSDELLLNPLGTVVQNPEVDSSTCLTVHFVCPMADERPIFYPSLRSIVDRVAAESTGDSQLPPEYPPNVIWLDCSDFNSPAFSVSATVESPTTKLSGTCLSSPDLRSSHFDYETAESHYSHEVRPRSNSSCGQSVQSNASRPDSGEFVPVQPLIDSCAVANRAESNNRRPSSDESGTRLTVPPQPRTNRSSSLSNLSILAALDGTIQLKPPLHSNTNQTLSNLSLQIPRSSSLSISNEELRRSPASGRKASKAYLQQLREICCKDPLHELSKGDIELVWFLRGLCRTQLPHSLSHLLAGVRWNCSNQVFEMLALLTHWPLLTPEHGLQLLDYAYCDLHVRRFAVRCLAQMSDEQLFLYLLQLVQALKFESYLHSELGTFLLHRALANQHIGHYLFWLLRSEMHEPCVSIKFGLLLEAYCRGAQSHMKILTKQLETLNKFREINEILREESNKRRESREKLKQSMKNILNQSLYKDAIKDVVNPLNPKQKLGNVRIEKCKFMDSKMKPLWLVFSNEDLGAEDIQIIYKNGDDLRQDMLTLQMLRIMDKLWKDEGLDLRMSVYNVIATDFKMGLIEVVQSANTVANIQKQKAFTSATSAFQKSSLLQWLREQNPDEDQLLKAIDEFTKSCAGYCVATYVLGIADRHSDNIMIRSNGQLLHIDFGHILGKFKEKWKIRRERVPFVLTNDFVHVITNGNSKKNEAKRFAVFSNYCEQAFLILRRKGTFMIALFAMMLATGLEMSSVKDLDYLRDTLVLQLNEAEALKHFRSKFDESLKNSWKTSFNWFAHNIAKDNK